MQFYCGDLMMHQEKACDMIEPAITWLFFNNILENIV